MVTQEKIIGVYKITNEETSKYYIGYSQNIHKRFKQHKKHLEQNKHLNILLQRSYNKYGIDKFSFEILHIFDKVYNAKKKELEYLQNMDIRNMLFNLNFNNSGGDTLTHHPDKENIIKRRTETVKSKMALLSEFEKKLKWAKFGEKNGMYGKNHTDETKEKISIANKGISKNLGFKHSDSMKKKISELGKKKIKDKNPFYGKIHTDETKEKISLCHIGKIPKNATPIMVDNINYDSLTDAGRKLNLSISVIIWRLKSKNPKFQNYKYTNEDNIKKSINCKISIDNIIYNSIRDAVKELKFSTKYIKKRLKSNNEEDKDWVVTEQKREYIRKPINIIG